MIKIKLILQITIVNEAGRHVHATLRKQYDDGFVPTSKVEFEDDAWKGEAKVP